MDMRLYSLLLLGFCLGGGAGFVSCADTDAQYTIPHVDAPVVVSTTPSEGATIDKGDITITVEYDKRVFFASSDYQKLQLTGGTITSAQVLGTSNTLTIKANVPDLNTSCSLTIPEGLVTGPNNVPAPAVTLTFKTKGTPEIASAPVAATSLEAVALYNYLKQNYRVKILSGMMANVAWNNDESEQVYKWTGKYPAINGYDYIHLQSSIKGAGWIDYSNITPLKEWHSNGGIVTIGWHWMAPKKEIANGDVSGLDDVNDFAFYTKETDFDLDQAVTDGTWQNAFVKADLARIVPYLKQLKEAGIPVLWRPLHEASGGWFWWGKDAASYKKLWVMMFDYFKQEGLDNLLWIWTSEGNDADWYPGDAYVDIIGRDIYGADADKCKAEYENLESTYGKMVTLSECGLNSDTQTSMADIQSQWDNGATWSWFMPWYKADYHTTKEWWQTAFNDDRVITRDEVNIPVK